MAVVLHCGTDLVEIERIRKAVTRLGQPFLDRIWTAGEQGDCYQGDPERPAAAASLAARFAAKEAVAKALGTGIGRLGIRWTDLVVVRTDGGAPAIRLEGSAREVYARLGGQSLAISLAHEQQMAVAFCVLLCDCDKEMTHA